MIFNPVSRYDMDAKRQLEDISPNLSCDLSQIVSLSDAQGELVLKVALERSCCAQNARNITLGREIIMALPREWVLPRIDGVAQRVLNLTGDDWEYRRLLEVYDVLDRSLLKKLVAAGLTSDNEGIREAAEEFNPEN
jgi:hypothetical protein